MRFRTITDTPLNPLSQVFRESRLTRMMAVLFGLIMVGVGGYVVWSSGDWFAWLFPGFASLFVLLFGVGLVNTFRSENWLLRYKPPKLLIKIRSCDNHRMPDDEPVVMELDTSEIAWIRKRRDTIVTSSKDGKQTETRTYLELKLRDENLGDLEQHLKTRPSEWPLRHITGATSYISYLYALFGLLSSGIGDRIHFVITGW